MPSKFTKGGEGLFSYNDDKAAYLKNYYSFISRIDVNLLCHIVLHMVAILACNKDDLRCSLRRRKH